MRLGWLELGIVFVIFLLCSFKHDKAKKLWGDVWGFGILICAAILIWSTIMDLLSIFTMLN